MARRSWLLMAVLAATWGASYLLIKVGLRDFSAPFVVFARTALAAAVLVPVARRRGGFAPLRGRLGMVVLLALLQVVLPFLLITVGERWVASSLTGILVAAAPAWAALLAFTPYAPAQRPGPVALAGLAVGLVGVGLLFGVDLGGSTTAIVGGLMILAASLGYAAGAIELKRRAAGIHPAVLAASTMGTSAVLVLPAALLTLPSAAGADSVAAVLALGVLGTGLAFLLFYGLIAELGAQKASLVGYLTPPFAVAYGVVVLGERVTAAAFAGLALILAGSWLAAGGRLPLSRSAPSRSSSPAPGRAR